MGERKWRIWTSFWGTYYMKSVDGICNGNWTEWNAIWSEIIRVISKSNERAARVRFEIISMISDQNCTPLSSVTTLLNPFWNRTILWPWVLDPNRAGLLEIAEPETHWHLIEYAQRCHVTKTHTSMTNKLGSISAALSCLVYPPREEFGGGVQAPFLNSGW